MKDISKIIEDYRNSAVNHWKASCEGDHKTANKYYSRLTKIYKLFLGNREILESVLPQLINDNDYAVQTWASAHSLGLGFMKDEAESRLLFISNLPANEAPSFEAKMTLKVWKDKGALTF
jgi:hypothetical protein